MGKTIDITNLEKLQANWNYPAPIRFGIGRIAMLGDVCKVLEMQAPLLVTDAGLVEQAFVQDIVQANQQAGLNISVFSDVKSNPTGSNIEAGVTAYHEGGHDGVIALGGGSALDAGKAIALMSGQERSLWDYEDVGDNWMRIDPNGIAATIAIPTTAGTGSEVGRAAVIVDEAIHSKKIIFHPNLMPDVVIADAQLSVGLPPHITAATGMDAFVHNLEAYCSPLYHPMADGIALEAMRLIKQWLPLAFESGDDLTARSHMMAASTMGATAFQKGLGAVHALAHPLGALFDAHHGLLNAILLPYVLQRNRPKIEAKLTHIARYLDLEEHSFDGFFNWLMSFRAALGIPENLKTIGINTERQEVVGWLALQDASSQTNPVEFSEQQYSEIFVAAVNGDLM